MLSLAGAVATRSHRIPAPELWAPMDADPAAMGFSFVGLTFTALPAERFLKAPALPLSLGAGGTL